MRLQVYWRPPSCRQAFCSSPSYALEKLVWPVHQLKKSDSVTVSFIASAALPTQWGQFTIHGFEDSATGKEHVALAMGDLGPGQPILCRLHSECLTGDCLFSLRCDCGPQLLAAMQRIAEEGQGLILYLRQERKGHWLTKQNQSLWPAGQRSRYGRSERTTGVCCRWSRI